MINTFSSPEEYFKNLKPEDDFNDSVRQSVTEVITKVRAEGDVAVRYFTQKFDGVELTELRVGAEALQHAENDLRPEVKGLFNQSIENIRKFHEKQLPKSWLEETRDGSIQGIQYKSIDSVGVYVPGGTAGYPSTVMMTVVPAQIAGVQRIVLVSPPGESGTINSYVLAVASLLGVKEVYAVGGAQAIAALAYGTNTLTAVDKIVGPGNSYVNEAKRQVFGKVGIDSLAGPTEIVILADDSANPVWVAQDLFAQAEHDPETRVICVTTSVEFPEKLKTKMDSLLKETHRKEILEKAIAKHGAIILAGSMDEAVDCVNKIASEHLQICTHNPKGVFLKIRNAAAIFVGNTTSAVVGDYAAGPNHVLPTDGNARFSSPLGVPDFMKYSSVFGFSESAFKKDAARIAAFANLEGLYNHEQSIRLRDESIR